MSMIPVAVSGMGGGGGILGTKMILRAASNGTPDYATLTDGENITDISRQSIDGFSPMSFGSYTASGEINDITLFGRIVMYAVRGGGGPILEISSDGTQKYLRQATGDARINVSKNGDKITFTSSIVDAFIVTAEYA